MILLLSATASADAGLCAKILNDSKSLRIASQAHSMVSTIGKTAETAKVFREKSELDYES